MSQKIFSEDMQDVIFDSDLGPELTYYLGKNPTEAARLRGLLRIQVTKELGRLEDRFQAAVKRPKSKAPNPLNKVDGGKDVVVGKESTKQFADRRNKELHG